MAVPMAIRMAVPMAYEALQATSYSDGCSCGYPYVYAYAHVLKQTHTYSHTHLHTQEWHLKGYCSDCHGLCYRAWVRDRGLLAWSTKHSEN